MEKIIKFFGMYRGKEDYVHPYSMAWRMGHIYATVFKENKDLMKGKILYLGCNAGTSVCVLSKYCDEVVGVDINENAIKRARQIAKKEKIKNVLFIHANICDMPFDDNHFDGVYAFQVIEHIYPEHMDMVLEEIKRVTKKGGAIVVEVPHPDNEYYKDNAHKYFFDSRETIMKVIGKYFNVKKIFRETRFNPKTEKKFRHNDWGIICQK